VRDVRSWLILFGLAALVVVLAIAGQAPSDSPYHAVGSDGAGGTSALRQLAGRLGHPTGVVEGDFSLPPGGLLFVFTPTAGFTDEEARDLRSWVEGGGVLVYAAETASQPVEGALGLARVARPAPGDSAQALEGLPGVGAVDGAYVQPFVPSLERVAILGGAHGPGVGVRLSIGQGSVFALADPLALGNGHLLRADNAPFAADLLAYAAPGSTVRFDEFHHGAQNGGSVAGALYSFAWGQALIWAVLVLFVGLAIRGRVVGPAIPLHEDAPRSLHEHTEAVGRLLQRTGGRREALDALVDATRRAVARRHGLAVDTARPDFHDILGRRDPETDAALRRAEMEVGRAAGSDAGVLAVGRALHDLAYPVRPRTPQGGDRN